VADPILTESLRRVAAEAATRLTSLVATGEELPFDVAENEGEHTFYRYVPLTAQFVHEHADELRSMPAFGPACSAIDSSGAAAAYLEARGEQVPKDPVERADRMVIAFIARLWDGSAEFRIDKPRLEAALRELEFEVEDVGDADVLLAPLVGLQMGSARLELPSGVRILRGDTVDAPAEATRSDGMQRNAWDPQFLAVVEREDGPTGAAPALGLLRDLISVLRLFKEGGVGLGPQAFTPTGEGTWKRIATGVPAPRPGGYKLSEDDAEELADFARRLEARPDPDGSLAWAVARFEMGCDRSVALEALSDHLLAMRALFEGSGPVGANLPMRVAALLAEPPERPEAYEKLQAAFELERVMMAGGHVDLGTATGIAAWAEDATRSIVRGAALGEHGTDVAASADETLVATGLQAGEGDAQQMGADEWDPPTQEEKEIRITKPEAEESDEVEEPKEPTDPEPVEEPEETEAEQGEPDPPAAEAGANERDLNGDGASERELSTRAESNSEPEEHFEDGVYFDPDEGSEDSEDLQGDEQPEEETVSTSAAHDWLSEVSDDEEGETMEWPAPVSDGPDGIPEWRQGDEDEEPLEEPRIRHLFPVPEESDWEVGELDYDRSETTRVS
jgi:nitroreductase